MDVVRARAARRAARRIIAPADDPPGAADAPLCGLSCDLASACGQDTTDVRPATMADAPAQALPKGLSLGQKLSALEQEIEARVAGAGKGVLRTLEAGRRGVDALFHQNLKASSPLTSCVWYGLKHPVTRSLTTIIVLLLNLFVYYGDPATFSNSESYGTMIGDIWHGWFEPDEVGWFLLRWCVMIFLGLVGLGVGIKLQHWLRDTWHLALFGYDSGEHEKREPTVLSFLCIGMWHAFADGNCHLPLAQDLFTFYEAARSLRSSSSMGLPIGAAFGTDTPRAAS